MVFYILFIHNIIYFNGKEEFCFYVGKSTNILDRLLKYPNLDIYSFLNENYNHLVPRRIKEFLDVGYYIKVEIKEVSYNVD